MHDRLRADRTARTECKSRIPHGHGIHPAAVFRSPKRGGSQRERLRFIHELSWFPSADVLALREIAGNNLVLLLLRRKNQLQGSDDLCRLGLRRRATALMGQVAGREIYRGMHAVHIRITLSNSAVVTD